jgi:hypothetical protein
MFPTVIGREFANGILTKYHSKPGGIYYPDPGLRMLFMEPNRTETMYYNGYTWLHKTDRFGFRNFRTVSNADVVLLGDSFIYGHGVDVEKTVGYFIEQISGHSVFNLARQGDCSLQQAYLITEYVQQFTPPKYVLYFFYENDISDLWNHHRTDEELMSFINTPLPQIKYEPKTDIKAAIKARDEGNYYEARGRSLYGALKHRSHLMRMLDWIEFAQNRKRPNSRPPEAKPTITPESHVVDDIDEEESIGWRYTKKAILYMNYISHLHGSRFSIVPITPDEKRHYTILKKFASEQKINFIDTQAINRANQSLFLPMDGHFSEKGAKAMAQIVIDQLLPTKD